MKDAIRLTSLPHRKQKGDDQTAPKKGAMTTTTDRSRHGTMSKAAWVTQAFAHRPKISAAAVLMLLPTSQQTEEHKVGISQSDMFTLQVLPCSRRSDDPSFKIIWHLNATHTYNSYILPCIRSLGAQTMLNVSTSPKVQRLP